MNNQFKPCGSGDNICNCTQADECGYKAPFIPSENSPLIDKKQYYLWRDGEYLGIATFNKNETNLGDCFLKKVDGVNLVYIANAWLIKN